MDTLLESSKSSSNSEYSFKSHKALIETLTKEHAKNLGNSTKAVENSEKTVRETTEKVEKLLSDVTQFMAEFQKSSDQNTAFANKVLTSLGTTLLTEKEVLSKVHSELRVDNAKMSAFIVSKIKNLQEDLATKNKLMDKLAIKTEKTKVLSLRLSQANKQINDHNYEKVVLKICVAVVNLYLQNPVETRDSLLTVSER